MKTPFLLLLFASFVVSFACAQADLLQDIAPTQIEGKWKGTLSQGSGGLATEYHFELDLKYKNKKISGSSYISDAKTKSYARIELKGELQGTKVVLQETKITTFSIIPSAEWCIKNMPLEMDYHNGRFRLKGKWTGASSVYGTCIPGEIEVFKDGIKA